VSGVERSGIAADALVEGRAATIVGIVKRAYPTASDQRFALVPRSSGDIRLGAASATERPDASGSPNDDPDATPDGVNGLPAWPESFDPARTPDGSAPPPNDGNATVAVADLAGHLGQRVVVGGFVTAIDGARLTVQDETAATVVRLSGDALLVLERIAIGDLVNAAGVADRNAAGGIEIAVSDPADIAVLPPTAAVTGSLQPSVAASPDGSSAATTEPPATPTAAPTGIAALILLAAGIVVAATFVATPSSRARVREWLEGASSGLKERLAQLRSS
jgi:hypothetical protein